MKQSVILTCGLRDNVTVASDFTSVFLYAIIWKKLVLLIIMPSSCISVFVSHVCVHTWVTGPRVLIFHMCILCGLNFSNIPKYLTMALDLPLKINDNISLYQMMSQLDNKVLLLLLIYIYFHCLWGLCVWSLFCCAVLSVFF